VIASTILTFQGNRADAIAGRTVARHGIGIAISVWYDEIRPDRKSGLGGLAK
jgi:hypothetical protein